MALRKQLMLILVFNILTILLLSSCNKVGTNAAAKDYSIDVFNSFSEFQSYSAIQSAIADAVYGEVGNTLVTVKYIPESFRKDEATVEVYTTDNKCVTITAEGIDVTDKVYVDTRDTSPVFDISNAVDYEANSDGNVLSTGDVIRYSIDRDEHSYNMYSNEDLSRYDEEIIKNISNINKKLLEPFFTYCWYNFGLVDKHIGYGDSKVEGDILYMSVKADGKIVRFAFDKNDSNSIYVEVKR